MHINLHPRGSAALEVGLVFNQSTVTAAYATSPMKLLTPRSRGPTVISYASNFGGGLVAGDQTRLELRVGKGARCFLGTQASTKIYRNPMLLPCGHSTYATLEDGALLVMAPAPVQPFAESSYAQRQEFHLAPEAGLVLLDWVTSGRAACGERWAFARFSSRNEVWQDQLQPGGAVNDRVSPDSAPKPPAEECIFLDSLDLTPADGPMDALFRTGRFNCFALLLLAGAPLREAAAGLLKEVGSHAAERRGSLLVSASPTRNGAVLRLAGEEIAPMEHYLRQDLAPLRSLLGDDPWARRW